MRALLILVVALGASVAACSVDLVDPATMDVGACFDAPDPEAGRIEGVSPIPCDEAHEFELYAEVVVEAPGGASYPGEDVIAAQARSRCASELERYADVWAAERRWDFGFFFPDDAAWARGDRTTACYLYPYGGGTMEGSAAAASTSRRDRRELAAGDCFDRPPTEFVFTIPIVSCTGPHDFEVITTFDLEDGEYPGVASIEQLVAERCTSAVARLASGADVVASYLAPSPDGWEAGDRTVVCLAQAGAGRLEAPVGAGGAET